MTDVWEFPRVQGADRHGHATPKPIEAMQRIINTSSMHGYIVYDPFGGSGTTMSACEQLGRRCRMIEISEAYCSVVLERMAGMGLEASKLEAVTNGSA